MDAFLTADGLIALATLTFLEVVLGVDNVIFISILTGKLPAAQQPARGGSGSSARWACASSCCCPSPGSCASPSRSSPPSDRGFSGRDLILISGGLFLLWKATMEIHEKLEGEEAHGSATLAPSFGAVIGQIMLLDIIFSLDSVITAVGMASDIAIMITAVVVAVGIMMVSARTIGDFVMHHPTVKVLALSFLLMIGLALVGDGVGFHIPKGYIYFAMGFSMFVETINLRVRPGHAPVKLHETVRMTSYALLRVAHGYWGGVLVAAAVVLVRAAAGAYGSGTGRTPTSARRASSSPPSTSSSPASSCTSPSAPSGRRPTTRSRRR